MKNMKRKIKRTNVQALIRRGGGHFTEKLSSHWHSDWPSQLTVAMVCNAASEQKIGMKIGMENSTSRTVCNHVLLWHGA